MPSVSSCRNRRRFSVSLLKPSRPQFPHNERLPHFTWDPSINL